MLSESPTGKSPAFLDIFRNVLGCRLGELPSRFSLTGEQTLGIARNHHLWVNSTDLGGGEYGRQSELWPLISHHTYPTASRLRGAGRLSPELLTNEAVHHLLLCHGLVMADPLRVPLLTLGLSEVIERGLCYGDSSRDSDVLLRVINQLRRLEPIIDAGYIKFVPTHPEWTSEIRRQFMAPFHLGHDLETLRNLVELGYADDEMDARDRAIYVGAANELLDLCGIESREHSSDLHTSRRQLEAFGAALLETSWQLAIAAEHPMLDLYLSDPLERRVFELLVKDAEHGALAAVLPEASGEARNLPAVAVDRIPGFKADSLSIADVVRIRADDAFENWRRLLNGALDRQHKALQAGRSPIEAQAELRDGLVESRVDLEKSIKKGGPKLNTWVGAGTVGFSVVSTTATQFLTLATPTVAALNAGGAAVGAAGAALLTYLAARSEPGDKVLLRHLVSVTGTTGPQG